MSINWGKAILFSLFNDLPLPEKKSQPMTKLSVNINKIALLRNSRGGNVPNLVQFAKDCEAFGAEGITVHPRPDQRISRNGNSKIFFLFFYR